jgi:UDP-2,3-diacylglucosamine pyrophosphatase LpxH
MTNTNQKDIKRLFLISDLHFGIKSNNPEWLKIQTDYFYNFFIPLVKEHKRDGDACFILGDIFDSRQSLNILVMNSCIEIFRDLGKIFTDSGVYVMTGNHDCWTKDSSQVHSLSCISALENVYVYNRPELISVGNKDLLLMPWGMNPEEEKRFLETNSSDILFVHTDIKDARFNAKVTVEHGNSPETYRKHKKVYGGHIHYRQKVNDFITLIGCPYQMTRSDIGNKKGLYIVDLETSQETFIENDFSPEFISVNFDSFLELSREHISGIIKNKFVDLKVTRKWLEEIDIPGFVQSLTTQRSIEIIEKEEDDLLNMDIDFEFDFENEATPRFDILSLSKELINNLEYDEETKNKVENKITLLFEAIKEED